jgi:hypothetical protein
MSADDELQTRLRTALAHGLTPAERASNERFMAFWDAWPQTEADFDPDEWWRAEMMREAALDVLGFDAPVRYWAEWWRAGELYDELYGFTREER